MGLWILTPVGVLGFAFPFLFLKKLFAIQNMCHGLA